MVNNELTHHGIRGQKWGERNYQYKDGSLTPAGKARYSKGTSSKGFFFKKNSTKKKSSDSSEKKEKLSEEQKEKIIKSGNIKAAKANINSFSNDELNKVIARYELNTRVSSLANADIKTTEQKVKSFANRVGTYAEVVEKGTRLYNGVAKVVNSTSDSKWPIIGDGKKEDKKVSTTVTEIITKDLDDGGKKTVTKVKKY